MERKLRGAYTVIFMLIVLLLIFVAIDFNAMKKIEETKEIKMVDKSAESVYCDECQPYYNEMGEYIGEIYYPMVDEYRKPFVEGAAVTTSHIMETMEISGNSENGYTVKVLGQEFYYEE